MIPCPHCQQTDPVVYAERLYCGACNTPYPVTQRVYAPLRKSRETYIQMRDIGTELLSELDSYFADMKPSPELIEARNWVKEMCEQCDEMGNT